MISIIIPVYNTGKYLDQCLLSVVEQSYTDWECIIVDDGSTDNSGEVCDSWGNKDNRFVVIHQDNGGVSLARNHGLEVSRGEYICFIDSDDWVGPDYLIHLVSGMTDNGVDMVVTGTLHERATTKARAPREKIRLRIESDFTHSFIENVGLFYGPCSILFKASFIQENRILFPEKLSFGEDTTFVFSYLGLVNDIILLPFADYHYRILNQTSLSHRFGEEKTFLRYELWEMRKSFYINKGMWNPISQKNMYRELWAIVYDGLFSIKKPSFSYMKKILGLKEIEDLKEWPTLINISNWVRFAILKRCALLLFIMRSIK